MEHICYECHGLLRPATYTRRADDESEMPEYFYHYWVCDCEMEYSSEIAEYLNNNTCSYLTPEFKRFALREDVSINNINEYLKKDPDTGEYEYVVPEKV